MVTRTAMQATPTCTSHTTTRCLQDFKLALSQQHNGCITMLRQVRKPLRTREFGSFQVSIPMFLHSERRDEYWLYLFDTWLSAGPRLESVFEREFVAESGWTSQHVRPSPFTTHEAQTSSKQEACMPSRHNSVHFADTPADSCCDDNLPSGRTREDDLTGKSWTCSN